MSDIQRKNEKGAVEVAICPLCNLRVEFIGAAMVRCYTTGEKYDPEEIIWVLESKVPKDTGYDVENIRGTIKIRISCPVRIRRRMGESRDRSDSIEFFYFIFKILMTGGIGGE